MEKKKKEGRYERIYAQLEALLQKPSVKLSRMATVVAVLSHKMDYFFWTGFYLLVDDELARVHCWLVLVSLVSLVAFLRWVYLPLSALSIWCRISCLRHHKIVLSVPRSSEELYDRTGISCGV